MDVLGERGNVTGMMLDACTYNSTRVFDFYAKSWEIFYFDII